jgi:hypothetical protein
MAETRLSMTESKGDPTAGREWDLVVVLAPSHDRNLARRRVNRDLSAPFSVELQPIFSDPGPESMNGGPLAGARSQYFSIDADDAAVDDIVEAMRARSDVAAAYAKPRGFVPRVARPASRPPLPDLTTLQTYLGPAPGGVGAIAAWNTPGGDGDDVRVVDVEENWNFDHEDLQTNSLRVVAGTPPLVGNDHGTAVIGIIGSDHAFRGTTGIAPASSIGGAAISTGTTVATTIDLAARALRAGDILLIEWEVPGPGGPSIPVEWWPAELLAIQTAVTGGIIVVSAAGNGGVKLDDVPYDTALAGAGFPLDWMNPFRRGVKDSGSILVGAGAPPPGTNGMNHGPDRSRLPESNFGDCVDVQGWGREVATTGYGDIDRSGVLNPNQFYTSAFPQTSAAAAIVAGVIACVQGARKKAGKALWDSFAARRALRDPRNGTPQPAPATERIGPRPNLAVLLGLP